MSKPDDWTTLTPDDKRQIGVDLLNSTRGRMLIARALAETVATLKTAEWPERSDIEDMEILGETVFEQFYSLYSPETKAMLAAFAAQAKARPV